MKGTQDASSLVPRLPPFFVLRSAFSIIQSEFLIGQVSTRDLVNVWSLAW